MNEVSPATNAEARRVAKVVDKRSPLSVFDELRAPEGDRRPVVVVRPPYLLAKDAYTAPIALPIGPCYVAASVEKAGYNVSIVDAVGEAMFQVFGSDCGRYNTQGLSVSQIVERIPADAAVIGISMMFSVEWIHNREVAEGLRDAFPDATIIVGGEHATAVPELVLRTCPAIDFVVTGEGDLAFLDLVHGIFTGIATDDVPGVHFIDPEGGYHTGGLSPRIMNVDEMPRPAWNLIDVEHYFIDNWTYGIATGRNMAIMATRGCPYQCTFCSNPFMWTTRYLMRDVNDVVDEIEDIVERYQATSIDFMDLTAITKKDWTMAFCNELKRRKLDVVWQLPSGTRSEALDVETLTALYETGCRLLVYAPESGSQESLDIVKKRLKLPNIIESMRQAARIGHTVKMNVIIGFPHENHRHVMASVFFAWKVAFIGAEDLNLAIFNPYPGSELFKQLCDQGVIGELDDDYFMRLLVQGSLSRAVSFTPHISPWFLAIARVAGMGGFYTLAYLTHPGRIWRVIRNALSPRFQAHNLIEQRIHDFIVRRRAEKASA